MRMPFSLTNKICWIERRLKSNTVGYVAWVINAETDLILNFKKETSKINTGTINKPISVNFNI